MKKKKNRILQSITKKLRETELNARRTHDAMFATLSLTGKKKKYLNPKYRRPAHSTAQFNMGAHAAKDSWSFGTSLKNDFVISEKGVSREHFIIWREIVNNVVTYHLADRSSTYGTCVNGKRVRDAELKGGDTIVVAGAWIPRGQGDFKVGCCVGEEWNSAQYLSNRYFYTFDIQYTFGNTGCL